MPKTLVLFAVLSVSAVLIAGCQPVEVVEGQPKMPKPLPPEAFAPTTDVASVRLVTEMTAVDTDSDGVPDTVIVYCLLVPPPSKGPTPVVGKGSFRFELFDSQEPAANRMPLAQINYNFEQSLRYGTRWWGQPAYRFPIKFSNLPPGVNSLYIKGRFFPEGMPADDPEAEPECGGVSVLVSSSVAPIRPAPARPPVSTGPDTGVRVIRLRPTTQADK